MGYRDCQVKNVGERFKNGDLVRAWEISCMCFILWNRKDNNRVLNNFHLVIWSLWVLLSPDILCQLPLWLSETLLKNKVVLHFVFSVSLRDWNMYYESYCILLSVVRTFRSLFLRVFIC